MPYRIRHEIITSQNNTESEQLIVLQCWRATMRYRGGNAFLVNGVTVNEYLILNGLVDGFSVGGAYFDSKPIDLSDQWHITFFGPTFLPTFVVVLEHIFWSEL